MAKQAVSRQVETGDQARRGRRVRAVLCGASVPALLVLAACSGSHVSGFGSGDGSTPGTLPGQDGSTVVGGNDGSTTILSGGDGAVGSADGSADCPASAKLVYITGIGSELYSFYPPTFTFTKIGKLSCLGPQLSPTHMTVDRQGTAWVVASNGIAAAGLYNASTADASCSKVSTWTAQPKNFPDFALTFLGMTNGDTTLYMLGPTSLGTFDTATGAVTIIGAPSVPSTQGDMTTNEDGTLYFLMDDTSIALYEVDPTNASVMKTMKPSATGGGDQALAYWGGSFYAFENNIAYQFDPKAQTTTKLGNAPIQVTGAGQSTCVPTVPPPSK